METREKNSAGFDHIYRWTKTRNTVITVNRWHLFKTCPNVIKMLFKDILVLFMLFLIGFITGNSHKTDGKLVSWYLNTGNYRPVSLASVSHNIM